MKEGILMLSDGNLKGVQHLGIPVVDVEKARDWYVNTLNFKVDHEEPFIDGNDVIKAAFISLGNLVIELYQLPEREKVGERNHGNIDHFAIDVLDIETAARDVLSKGGRLHESTRDGVVYLKDFGVNGVKYINFEGPSGEKVELNQDLDLESGRRVTNILGWNHLGIPVLDLDETQTFYKRFGFKEVKRGVVKSEDGIVNVIFLEKDGFIIEFYKPVEKELKEIASRKAGHVDHIALDVTDAEKAFEELSREGYEALEGTPVHNKFYGGVVFFTIQGPNGEKIEFNQKL
jgi:lactoylglutathione lyase